MKKTPLQCYYEIAQHCEEAIYIFDKAGIVVHCNSIAERETSFGEALKGISICEIFPALFSVEEGELRWKTTETRLETSAYRKNKTCYPVRVGLISMIDEEMPPGEEGIAGIVISADYTEQKESVWVAKQSLAELEYDIRMRSQFMANITHELRTPVNGMKGMAENLLDTPLTLSQQETVNIIIRNCNNMSAIINDILDLSKIEAGKMTIERAKFNFRKFLDDLLTFHLAKVNEKGLKLIASIAPEVPTYLITDEVRLGQVLNNLIANALKFTAVGYIALEVSVVKQTSTQVELFFMVIDTGIGISEEEKERLFKSFSQVDGSITRKYGGTGLGLAISKQLVELMGGQIRLDSEKGKGSSFSFTIKASIAQPDEEDEEYPTVGQFRYGKGGAGGISYGSIEDEEVLLSEEENLHTAKEALEKLRLCVDLGNWEKAEEFAAVVKNMIPDEQAELRKLAFRMELSVRKEDTDKAAELGEQLETELNTLLNRN